MPGVAEEDDRFGWAVTAGDFDGDGADDLATGAYNENSGAGYAIVLYGAASTGLSSAGSQGWWQDSAGISDTAESGDFFGSALAAGDLTGDGRDELVVGAWGENSREGVAHVLLGSAAGLTSAGSQLRGQDSAGVLDAGEVDDFFGYAVAVGDFTGDGVHADLAVGAPGEDGRSGAIHVLPGTATGASTAADQFWTQNSAAVIGASEPYEMWGESLRAARVVSPDRADLLVGIPGEYYVEDNEGGLHFMPGDPTGLTSDGDQQFAPSILNVEGDPHLNGFFGRALG